jgi:ParB family transcriptional regulator, chromosome partitioning protein
MRAPSKPFTLHLPELAGLDQPGLFDAKPVPTGEPLIVPIDRLEEDPYNPRTEFPAEALDELARDIAQRGVLQPIVVNAPDAAGRYRICFGSKRWRAARQAGLGQVPVILATRAHGAYDQVAENLKRHALSPRDLAKFIRGRVDAGESNASVATQLGLDQTTVAHHLALLDLPPVLDVALKTGRCASPRTLYELSKLHADQPRQVADLVEGDEPITRHAVAKLRDAAPAVDTAVPTRMPAPSRPDQVTKLLSRASALSEQLDAVLVRLSRAGLQTVSADALSGLRQRIAELSRRLPS